MFTSLNEDTNLEEQKNVRKEKTKIKKLYYKFLLENSLEKIIDYNLKFEENRRFYERIMEYALYNFIKSGNKRVNIEKYQLTKYKKPLLEYVEILIDDKEYLKARKLLNVAKVNGFVCNKYYDLEDRINQENR